MPLIYLGLFVSALSQAFHKQPAPPSPPSDSSQHGGTALSAASSLLHKVPGAKTVSLLNATVLGLLGLGAALAACGGGCTMLLVLLARWEWPPGVACCCYAPTSTATAWLWLRVVWMWWCGFCQQVCVQSFSQCSF